MPSQRRAISQTQRLNITRDFAGNLIPAKEHTRVHLCFSIGELGVQIDSPYHADPAPSGEAGVTRELWNYEVVEVFLLGSEQRYLELEFGPHGHYLALSFQGQRKELWQGKPLEYSAQIDGARWQGTARIPKLWLPTDLSRVNAYALHGQGEKRRFLAWHPTRSATPDFHNLAGFGPLR